MQLRPPMRLAAVTAILALLGAPLAFAQLRVAQWNVTNYAGGRVPEFQTSIYGEFEGRSLAPDILIVQEMTSSAAATSFRNMLNMAVGSPGDWAVAPFNDGPDTDNAFYYRTSKVTFLGMTVVAVGGTDPNHPRNVNRYDVRPVGYSADSTVLACYSTHMKAGSTGTDQARRLVEAQRIRSNARLLPAGWNYLVSGDFNMQDSFQAAYQELVGIAGNAAGQFFDPIKTPGVWNNTFSFRFIHTQDPVGAGGMDDRHDQILLGASLVDGDGFDYRGNPDLAYATTTWDDPNHSYRAWGNDGASFDTGIRIAGNTMVGPVIAQALRDSAQSAGHLPIVLDLLVPPVVDSETALDFGTVTVGDAALLTLHVENLPDAPLWNEDGVADLVYSLSSSDPAFIAPPGIFFDAATIGQNSHLIALNTSTAGVYSGQLIIASNAPDEPFRFVNITGTVEKEAGILIGDMNCDGVVSVGDIAGFVLALTNPAQYAMDYPSCDMMAADVDGNGVISVTDIAAFVNLLTGGG